MTKKNNNKKVQPKKSNKDCDKKVCGVKKAPKIKTTNTVSPPSTPVLPAPTILEKMKNVFSIFFSNKNS